MQAAAIFVASAGASLFFLSESTHLYFAWTIKSPVTAAFLGGGYLAVTTALVFALREQDWARVRVGVSVVATGLLSILATTLLHLDKFHLKNAVWSAEFWAWSWLFLYIILVPGLIMALWSQRRLMAAATPLQTKLPAWMHISLWLLGVLMLAMGALMFAIPGTAEQLWPWPLTPLTARMVGSFYLAFGVSLLAAARENDYARIHVASFAYVAFGVLQVITILRYQPVNWLEFPGQLLAAILLALIALGAAGVHGYQTTRSDE
jgi:MFS family permease